MVARNGTVIFKTQGDFVPRIATPLSLPTSIAQFAAGIKNPSGAQTKKIEDAIHVLADELKSIGLSAA